MTATEMLRRLLDERGVEWHPSAWDRSTETYWKTADGNGCLAIQGETKLRLSFADYLTPEQAIEATLGKGECEQEEHGWSTEGDHARVWLTCGHDCMVETVADLPNYCPHCGAKVVKA